MYQAEAFARGSPRPVAPWVKTIRHILPLCPPCPPRQAYASLLSPSLALCLPGPSDVGIAPSHSPLGAMRVHGHACLCCQAGAEGEVDVHTCARKRESIKPHLKQT